MAKLANSNHLAMTKCPNEGREKGMGIGMEEGGGESTSVVTCTAYAYL